MEYTRADLLSRALVHASLEVPALRARSRHWCVEHAGRIVGLAAQIEDVFPYRSAPIAAALPGAAAKLLGELERPVSCLAPEMLWRELERCGARSVRVYLQMARLRRGSLPDPDPAVKRIDDQGELRAFYGAELTSLRHELGPYFGIRGEGGQIVACAGVEFATPSLAQLSWIRTLGEHNQSVQTRAIVIELVRELETAGRRVILQVRADDEDAVQLYATLGFRGSRRFAKLEL